MTGLAVLAAVFVCYSLVAARLDRWSITAPMVFVATGVLIGPEGPASVSFVDDPETVKVIAELTLALLLFADASTLDWGKVKGDRNLPSRLLLIGFPLTVLSGLGAGMWLAPAAGWAGAALIASILAPTDAALGLGVFTNRAVPGRIRRALNVESGLNDGMATPLVMLFLSVLAAHEGVGPANWLAESARELGIAVLAAIVVGLGSGYLLSAARDRGFTSETSDRLAVLASALLAYGGSVAVGGNGFVAAFVAGLLFSAASRGRFHEAAEFTEDAGLFSSFLVWTLFGALLVGPQLSGGVDTSTILYALLSLTVVRMIPVAIAMIGSGLRPSSILFMGWFGPRGLASVVFTLIAFETLHESGLASEGLIAVATWTVLLSVIAHGVSARPLSALYGRAVADAPVENQKVGLESETHLPRSLTAQDSRRRDTELPTSDPH
jgi:NhaP-type Na+/H+ or K+/H+ antiporter